MMPKEYRNKLIATGFLLFAIMLFALIDGYFSNNPEGNYGTPSTEMISNTEE